MSTAVTWKETDVNSTEKRGKYTITVLGCDKTGLSTALLFADAGFKTMVADSNPYTVNLIKRGRATFLEQRFIKLIKKHVKGEQLAVTDRVKEAVSKSDVVIFAVSTPVDQKKKPDYSNMEKACKEMGVELRSGSLVIVESTVGPGVTETFFRESIEKASGLKAGKDFGLAYSPVSASSHDTFQDIAARPRVVGALDEQSLKAACLVLSLITKAEIIRVRNIKTAEAISLFENVYRDVNHALANELALFCEKADIDFFESQKAISTSLPCSMPVPESTIGYFVSEPYLLYEVAENTNVELRLAKQARKINEEMLNRAVHLTRDALKSCGKAFRRARISVLGVSGSTNVKEANHFFARNLVVALSKNGARVRVYDPFFSSNELIELDYQAEATLGKAVEGADCLLIAVGHDRFKRLNLRRIKFLMRKPAAIVDMCNVIDPDIARKEGFTYLGFGRG
jgi:nucleotide sugar dehydrogenase